MQALPADQSSTIATDPSHRLSEHLDDLVPRPLNGLGRFLVAFALLSATIVLLVFYNDAHVSFDELDMDWEGSEVRVTDDGVIEIRGMLANQTGRPITINSMDLDAPGAVVIEATITRPQSVAADLPATLPLTLDAGNSSLTSSDNFYGTRLAVTFSLVPEDCGNLDEVIGGDFWGFPVTQTELADGIFKGLDQDARSRPRLGGTLRPMPPIHPLERACEIQQ